MIRSPRSHLGATLVALVAAAAVLAGCGILQKSEAELAAEALQKGVVAQDSGRVDEARVSYFAALSHDPANKLAFYNLGQIARAQQKFSIAEGYYRQAMDLDAKDANVLFGLAYSVMARFAPNYPEAIDLYQKVIAIQPNNAAAHYNLGLVLRATDRAKEAEPEFQRAFQLDPALVIPAAPAATPVPSARPSATPSATPGGTPSATPSR